MMVRLLRKTLQMMMVLLMKMCCKKERKITAKGVALLFENLQRSSKLKLNQVNKIKQKVNDIIYFKITSETVPNVEKQMKRFVKYCEEAEDLHNSIVEMPIPQDEFDKQTKRFDAKLAENLCFQIGNHRMVVWC